ncbi:tetratricopeptide repeat protein [Winogradskyella haliclonae]|uniref:Tetratricopeptide repeat protein n=1 Tax=Winogradskyella haliclonae TaxID=2048558 RepID=A0ABQ2C082_9FLAO|nr:hypothetical protein [Winogradskyella haliclonae]GGI57168.1 hypothetical protein GCM10011444_14770 [Winogradskyella haliclonae]
MQNSSNFERGLQLYELNRFKDAIPYFENELTQNIDNFEAKLFLAYSYFNTDDISNAKNLSIELRKIAPNYAPTYHILSQIALHQEDNKNAKANIEQAISLDPFNADFFGSKSYILINQKEFSEALFYANKGLEIDAKNRVCLNARATCLTKLNLKEEAQETIENLLNDDPENSFSHANVGWSHLENNNLKSALHHFKASLKIDPNDEYARDGMLTAVKAKNVIYNWYLRYAFWMQKKSGKSQIFSLIAIYLVYRFSVKLLAFSGLSFLALPLIILYLLFALGTWIMEPISNMILLFDKYGKYLLDKDSRQSGQTMLALFSISIVSYLANLLLNLDILFLLSLSSLAATLPLSKAPLNYKKDSKIFDYIYGSIILLAPIIGYIIGYDLETLLTTLIILFVAYTWLASLIFR